MIRIRIASPQESVELNYAQLRTIGQKVLDGEGVKEAAVSVAFVDDATIQALNERYLDHAEPTDVLTFPLSGPKAKKLEGEVVIGVDVARREAAERGHSVDDELALYVIHGLLHLCGYDDHDEEDTAEMRSRERHWLSELGLPDIVGE
jgi:probable rRNA maturation factor